MRLDFCIRKMIAVCTASAKLNQFIYFVGKKGYLKAQWIGLRNAPITYCP